MSESRQLAREIARSVRGSDPAQVDALPSQCNDVFRMTFADADAAVVKIYARPHGADRERTGDRAATELAVLQRLRRRDVPVPVVEAAEIEAAVPWVLMTDAGGSPAGQCDGLDHGRKCAVFRRCGELLGLTHRIAFPIGGRFDSDDRQPLAVDGPIDPVLRWALGQTKAEPAWDAMHAAAMSSTDAVLCHGDFHPDQGVRSGDLVTAVVDWESATAGDPLADHAKFANYLDLFFVDEAASQALDGYADTAPSLDLATDRYLLLRLLHVLGLISVQPDNGECAERMRGLAKQLCTELGV
ncbi:MAG: aminoglycoside phosphotransferase family protein [Planctomycetota bacterium]